MSNSTQQEIEIKHEVEIKIVHELFMRNLRLLRVSQNITGQELSDKLGYKKGKRILDLESGRCKPKFEDLILIVDYFPITFNDLLEVELEIDIPSRSK